MRRIGDPEWRTFSSRADAARAFPGLTSFDVFNLIEKPRTCKKAVRDALRRARERDVTSSNNIDSFSSDYVSLRTLSRNTGSDSRLVAPEAVVRDGNPRKKPRLVSYTTLARVFGLGPPAVCVLHISSRRADVPSVRSAAINTSAGSRQRGRYTHLSKCSGARPLRGARERRTSETFGCSEPARAERTNADGRARRVAGDEPWT